MKEFILMALLCIATHGMMAVDTRCVITGTVVERRTLEPFAGIDVLLDGKRVGVTNTHGAFVIEGPDAGDHLVSAIIPEWGTYSAQVHCLLGATNDVRILAWPTAMANISGILAHYALDGNGIDDGPNGWHGTLEGAEPTEDRAGLADRALRFTGATLGVAVPHQARLNKLPLTLSCWIKMDVSCQSNCAFIGKYLVPNGDGWCVFLSDDRFGGGYFTEFFRNSTRSHGAASRDGSWHHIVYTMDSTAGVLYVDDARLPQVVAFKHTVVETENTEPFCIGRTTTLLGEEGFSGAIDDVYLFDHVLSDEERLLLTHAP